MVAMPTTHEPVPEHAPLHPEKVEPEAGAAASVTVAVVAKEALQVEPQLIPSGLLVTVPEPVPVFETVSVLLPGGAAPSNRAVMVAEALVTRH